MNYGRWAIVRFGLGEGATYGAMRSVVAGRSVAAIEYHMEDGRRWERARYRDAQGKVDSLNGAGVPRRCTPAEFSALVRHVPIQVRTRNALFAIMVEGRTWREAALLHCVTESGILRAMRRMSHLNEPLAA